MPDLPHFAFDFAVKVLQTLIGMFAGLVLALHRERKAREASAARERAKLEAEHIDVRRSLLSSVVKNITVAKKLKRSVGGRSDPFMLQVAFELSVWEAVNTRYVAIAPLDERILITRFFDQIRRLNGLIDFYRRIRADSEVAGSSENPGPQKLLAGVEERLRNMADDTSLDGVVLITDHGEDVHKRILGIKETRREPSDVATATVV